MTRSWARAAVGTAALAVVVGTFLVMRTSSRRASVLERPEEAPETIAPGPGASPASTLAARQGRGAEPGAAGAPTESQGILGRVVGEGGAPIAAATVIAVPSWADLMAAPFSGTLPRTLTSADGGFRFESGVQSRVVLAWAPGYPGRAEAVDEIHDPIEIVLRRDSGQIAGTIRDEKGAPISGARVFAGEEKGCGFGTTGADGTYAISRGGEGPVRVSASAAGYVAAGAEAARGVDRVDLVLRPGLEVRGRVLDATTGRGLAGSRVERANDLVEEVVAGPDGAFAIVVHPEEQSLTATAEGHSGGEGEIVRGDDGSATAEVRLESFVEYVGVVLDESGAPLPGAEVRVVHGGDSTSDSSGRFRVAGPPPRGRERAPVALVALAGERTPGVAVVRAPARSGIVLRMGAPAPLLGQVVDGVGAPRSQARVSLSMSGGPVWREGVNPLAVLVDPERMWLAVPVDGEGRFRATGLPEGMYEIHARPAPTTTWYATARGKVAPGEPAEEVRIVVEDGVVLSGVVVDDVGRPVPDANVALTPPGTRADSRSVTSDGDGRFHFEGAPTRPVAMSAYADGFGPWSAEVDPHDGEVRVVLRRRLAVRWRLRLGGDVPPDGTVLGVRVVPRNGSSGGATMEGVVGGGEVTIEWAALPGEHDVSAFGAGRRAAPVNVVVPALGGDVVARLRLLPTLAVSGVVRGPDGGPLAGVVLRAWNHSLIHHTAMRTSDEKGSFRFADLEPGVVRIEATREGLLPASLDVDAGREDVEIRLHRAAEVSASPPAPIPGPGPAADLSISGRVLTSAGQPPQHGVVMGFPIPQGGSPQGGSPPTVARMDEDGRFVLAGLVPGSYRIEASGDDGRASLASVAAGTEGIQIRLVDNGQIRGRIRPPEGCDLADLAVLAIGDPGTSWSARVEAQGRFVVSGVSPGAYRIVARAGGLVAATGPAVVVRAGEIVRDVVVDLVRGGAVEGQVRTAAGEPVVGAEISASGADFGIPPAHVTTGAEGRFRIEGLAPGTWRLFVTGGGIGEILNPVVEVEAGRTHHLDLTASR